jgi:polyhydroxyalkanoate synthesis regulator phasin
MIKGYTYTFIFITIFLGLLIFAPINLNSVMANKSSSEYKGPEYCGTCHNEEYLEWNGTMHSQAFSDPIFQGVWQAMGSPSYCLQCHTTGYNSETGEFALEGVTCERCHGGPGAMEVTLSAYLCGECHRDTHHPTFEEWNASKHSESIESLKTIGQDKNERCLGCHSAEGALGNMLNREWTVEEASTPITCAVCHDPMALELRVEPSSDLCGLCHSSQYELWSSDSPHGIMEVQCSDCHMYTKPYVSEEEPAITGHTFEIVKENGKPLICQNCHGVIENIPTYDVALTVLTNIQDKISGMKEMVRSAISETEDLINYAKTITNIDSSVVNEAEKLLEEAKHDFDIEVDRAYSNGFHNPTEMVKLIYDIMNRINTAKSLLLETISKALESQLSQSREEVMSLQDRVDSLSEQVVSLEERISELEAKAGMLYTYLAIGLIIGLVLGIGTGYIIKKRS